MTTETRTVKIGASSAKTKLPDGISELTLKDSELTGFALRIRKDSKRYVMRSRVKGGPVRKITLGDAATLTAAQARQRAGEIRNDLLAGVDPMAKPVPAQEAVTFAKLADLYFDRWSTGRLDSQTKVPRPASIATHLHDRKRALRAFGETPITEIDAAAIRRFRGDNSSEDISRSVRRRAFGAFSSILDHSVDLGYLDGNPAKMFKIPAADPARDRYLSHEELRTLWTACDSALPFRRMVRFLICQPVRLSIARNLKWSDIDLDAGTMTVPADTEGNKAREEFILPLTPLAVEVLEALPGRRSGLVFVGRNGGAVAAGSTAKALLDRDSGLEHWRVHDLRRTINTHLANAHTDLDVDASERWLMHKRTGIESVYQKANRLGPMRVVAVKWDQTLRSILGLETKAAEIVRIG